MEIAAVLRRLPGVSGVETISAAAGMACLTALPAAGVSLLEEMSGLLRESRWQIRELVQEPGRLEDVFRAVTSSAQAAQGGLA